jgi:hypothetical protein
MFTGSTKERFLALCIQIHPVDTSQKGVRQTFLLGAIDNPHITRFFFCSRFHVGIVWNVDHDPRLLLWCVHMGFEVNEFWACLQWALIGGHGDCISRNDARGGRWETEHSISLWWERGCVQFILCLKFGSSAIFRCSLISDVNSVEISTGNCWK